MEDRLAAKDVVIAGKQKEVNAISELVLPCAINISEIRELYIFRSTFEGEWAKRCIVEAFRTATDVRSDAYETLQRALRDQSGKAVEVCIMELARPSNHLVIQSTESVIYTYRGLKFLFWF